MIILIELIFKVIKRPDFDHQTGLDAKRFHCASSPFFITAKLSRPAKAIDFAEYV